MTFETLVSAEPHGQRFNAGDIKDGILKLERTLRPNEGWIATVLLVINLVVVVWSVEQANWVATPNLILVLFLAMLTGLTLYRVPVWSIALLPVGLVIGLSTILWQLSSFSLDGVTVGGTREVLERLELWLEAARTGSINIDGLPFGFALMTATWLTGFFGAWLFLRYSNFWGVFVLGGICLLSNLTFLPPNSAFHLGFYLFTALLLVARIQAVRRKHEWERRSVKVDDHLAGLSLSDSFALTVLVIILAFLVPVAPKWAPTNDAYESMRHPLESIEDDFNRLFAGLPARRPLGFRIWDNVMAFQGSIYPTTTQVLWVDSETEMYLKARTYSTYNGKGWLSEHTVTESLGYTPEFNQDSVDLLREEITYIVTPLYTSKKLFSSDYLLDVDQDVMIETQASPVFTIDLSVLQDGGTLPEYLQVIGMDMTKAIDESGPFISDLQLAQSLPAQFRMDKVDREDGYVIKVQFTEALPAIPKALSVTNKRRKFETGDPYQVTSAISRAEPEQLLNATTNYPVWISERYLQLPPNLPQRVRDLASRVTDGMETPYGKAKALEDYLRNNYPYNLRVDPPPFNADGVDHFLFTLGEGYSEYFASTMAVMLRTVGVPARLAVGYTTGDRIEHKPLFAVTDSHSHAWLEVYFPEYGWIPFEPTPGKSLPGTSLAEGKVLDTEEGGLWHFDPLDEECFYDTGDLFDCEEGEETQAILGARSNSGGDIFFIGLWPWALGVLGTLTVVGGAGNLLWRRFLAIPGTPRIAFRRMTSLAKLASAGPAEFQTPYQFGNQLREVIPVQRASVSIIVAAYVRSRYGNKYSTASERRLVAVAWQRLRLAMIWAVIKRRVR